MKRRLCLLLGLIALLASFYCIGAFATDAEPTLEISGKALELEATVGLSFAVPIEPAKGLMSSCSSGSLPVPMNMFTAHKIMCFLKVMRTR